MTKFNDEQKLAIEFHTGAAGIVAGAGSGKSTVLLNRIKNLVEVHNEPQNSILAISFTRKTADELEKKLSKMGLGDVNVGTFHSICGRILVQEGITLKLIQDWQVANYLKSVDKNVDIDDVKSFISYQKNHNKTFTDKFIPKDSLYNENELRVFFKKYETMKSKAGLCDFDDYLTMCLDILQKNKGKYTYEFILVDEHQDSCLVQNMILQELCQSGNMFCLYDPRQAIYSWRAGNIEYCINFDKYWENPTIINLYKNYRSAKNIVNNANKFIKPYFKNYEHYVDSEAHNQSDGEITIRTYGTREIEGVEVVDKIEELIEQGEKLSEIAVLYRMNLHSSFVENELKRRGIDYEITNDSGFFKLKEVEAILSYLRLLHNPHDDQAFETVFRSRNYPLKYLKNDMLDKAKHYSGLHDISTYEAFVTMEVSEAKHKRSIREFENSINKLRLQVDREASVITLISNIVKSFNIDSGIRENYSNNDEINDRLNSIDVLKSFVKGNNLEQFITYVYSNNTKKKSKKNSVKLMSIHSSKGLEWNNCFLIGIEDGKFPHEKSGLDEEARLLYVGITRSKENLYISQIGLGESGRGNQFILEYFGDIK
ncbi:DNA helicase UvrD [Peribacillus asahii]|uniref:DNA 3'-5' helicase n=1 Tax=Peribacillus asahii TaxID=228899 RepID=A0A3T0KTE9_9BACI|nr:ATP-dependent helicase [Peribacillus asahii]AZV43697.1 DNA helicase UvrD [Peribacillus asahii]